jgi:hypothetical protein
VEVLAMEYGIFNDESSDYTEDQALEAGFYSRESAEAALRERYSEDDNATVHEIEEPDEEDEDEDEDDSDLEDEDE